MLERLPGNQAATKLLSLFHLSLAYESAATSECSNDVVSFPDDRAQLLRICGDRVIPSGHFLIEGKVLFDHAGTERDSG